MDKLLKKINRNKKINHWWLKLLSPFIQKKLIKKMPAQTVGVFLNPYTSNQERIVLLRKFYDF